MKRATKFIIGGLVGLGLIGSVTAYAGKGWHGEGRVNHIKSKITKKLDLNEIQQGQLDVLASSMMDMRHSMFGDKQTTMQEIISIYDTEQVDRNALSSLIDSKLEQQRSGMLKVAGSMADFTESLDASQRSEFKTMVEKFRKHRRGHHHKGHHDKPDTQGETS